MKTVRITDRRTPVASLTRRLVRVAVAAGLVAGTAGGAQALSLEERRQLDLSDYTVTDPTASFFDVEARVETLRSTRNPMLAGLARRIELETSCRSVTAIPTIDFDLRMPGFYPQPDAWRETAAALFAFEDAMSRLTAGYAASGDPYFATCLAGLLGDWADKGALTEFHYTTAEPQAWYSTESMIFSAALAWSALRPAAEVDDRLRRRIDDWLLAIARNHSAISGVEPSCCNNHFYRRALYATMVGILAEDDELFQFGVSAIYSALAEMTEEGAFPREMQRGERAAHYQNYALLYLIPIMHLIEGQGYDVFGLEVDGNTIADAVNFNLDVLEDYELLEGLAPVEQYSGFREDDQYFAWTEYYLQQVEDPRVQELARRYRPIYNRGLGGHVTLLLMNPDDQRRRHRDPAASADRRPAVVDQEEAF